MYFAVSRPALTTGLGTFDEGQFCLGALKINHGQIPYRDFNLRYTPGAVYLYAWIFRLFGYEIVNVRAASLVTDALILAFVLALVWSVAGRFHAAIIGVTYAFWGVIQFYFLWHTRLSLLFIFAALAVLCFRKREFSFKAFAAAGFLCGVSFWFKQSVGLFALAGLLLFFLLNGIEHLITAGPDRRRTEILWREMLLPGAAVAAGFVLFLILFLTYYYRHGALEACLDSIFTAALRTKKGFLGLPGIFVGKLVFLTWSFCAGSFAMIQYAILRSGKYTRNQSRAMTAVVVTSSVYYSGLLGGGDFAHVALMVSCLFVAMGVFFGAAGDFARGKNLPAWGGTSIAVLAIVLAVFMAAYGITRARAAQGMAHEMEPLALLTERLDLPHAHVFVSRERKNAYEGIVRDIDRGAAPGECVFVFPYDVIFNYLLMRDNCVPYTELHQEVLGDAEIRTILRRLRSENVRFVILKTYDAPVHNTLIGGAGMYGLYRPLYDYVRTAFRLKKRHLYWELYQKYPDGR